MLLLEDVVVPVRVKLAGLWCSVMFCYIYGDYFELYQPGKLREMLAGKMALGAVTQGTLMGMAAVLVVPALMIFLSLVLPARVNRWANIVLGVLYSVVMILAVQGSWHFYVLMGVIEIALTISIAVYAWTWPKRI